MSVPTLKPQRGLRSIFVVLLGAAGLAACATAPATKGRLAASPQRPPSGAPGASPLRGTMKPYQVRGVWYYPHEQPDYDEVGAASWYGEQFHNRYTANGEVFDMDMPSAAHKTLPLPCIVEVRNLDNGRVMQVRVNDRGPFVDGRVIDLSRAAADQLGFRTAGVARVRVRYLRPAGRPQGFDLPPRYASASPVAPPPAVSPRLSAPPEPLYAAVAYAPVTGEALGPPRKAAVQSAPLGPVVAENPAASAAGRYRVQAGAFASRANAERAVVQLETAGEASIEPIERGGAVLYRVVLAGPADEPGAQALRERAAAFGFPDAKVLRPF